MEVFRFGDRWNVMFMKKYQLRITPRFHPPLMKKVMLLFIEIGTLVVGLEKKNDDTFRF